YTSAILALRHQLDLYACVRPVRGFAPAPRADLIVVRENTEGLYGGGEESDGQRAVARRVITRAASHRVARLAFSLARRLGRPRPISATMPPSSSRYTARRRTLRDRASPTRWPPSWPGRCCSTTSASMPPPPPCVPPSPPP